jgi:hypothetical protein
MGHHPRQFRQQRIQPGFSDPRQLNKPPRKIFGEAMQFSFRSVRMSLAVRLSSCIISASAWFGMVCEITRLLVQRKKPGGMQFSEQQRCAQGCLNLPGWLSPG